VTIASHLQDKIRLKHAAQNQATELLLNALASLHNTAVCRKEETLAWRTQTSHIAGVFTTNNPSQSFNINCDSSCRLADHFHLAKNRLVPPVLEAQPKASGGNIVQSYRLNAFHFIVGSGVSENRMGRGRSGTSTDDGGDVAGVLQSVTKLQVEVAVGDGGKTETSLGGIVQVRAHMGEIDERHVGFFVVAS